MTGRAAIEGSSFRAAAPLLPGHARAPTLRLYAVCRALDDVADEEGGDAARERLAHVAQDLRTGVPGAILPETRVFHDLAAGHGLCLASARHLVATLARDLESARLKTEAELLSYADGAAGTVGGMMCDLLCPDGAPADARARAADLGIAMQLTNIARDVKEDACMGRRYLPGDWCPVPPDRLVTPGRRERELASKAILRTLDLAERHYASARRGYGALPPRARLAVAIAAERYRAIGRAVAARPEAVWERRARPGAFGLLRACALGLSRGVCRLDARHRLARPRHA